MRLKLPHRRRKDLFAAALLILLGMGVAMAGARYRIGTLRDMGAGFVPMVLGMLLMLVGMAMAATAGAPTRAGEIEVAELHGPAPVDGRAWLCILGGVAAFVLLGHWGGFVPAGFVAVFISALGSRDNSAKDAALLALAMVVAGALVFRWGLHVQLPLFGWGL